VPGLPDAFDLEPDLILPLFLPPLLFATAQRTSWAVFRARWRTIAFLAVALVAATVAAVAGTAAALAPGLTVTAAIALGAMVAPPDPVAVEAVAGPARMPRRLLAVLPFAVYLAAEEVHASGVVAVVVVALQMRSASEADEAEGRCSPCGPRGWRWRGC
jgi:NhaP-type Na+/H+ or K+/H+ antiporter